MLLNLAAQQKNKLQQQIKEGTFVQSVIDDYCTSIGEDKPFDGYIHPSYLDWSKTPEQQVKALFRKGTGKLNPEAYRAFAQGNVIHELIENAFDGRVKGYSEIGYASDKILFRGTADYVGEHPILGGILFEFKSYSELQVDNTTGRVLFAKVEQLAGNLARESKNPATKDAVDKGILNRYHLVTNSQMDEIQHRLASKERVKDKPDSDHLTQAATYAWIFNKIGYGVQRRKVKGEEVLTRRELPEINWLCICYLGKGKWKTREFWIPIHRKPGYIAKAKRNYSNVLKVFRTALNEIE